MSFSRVPGSFKIPRGPLSATRDPLKGPRGPFKGPRGPLKGPRGHLIGPRGSFKGPGCPLSGTRGPFKGPRGPFKGSRGPLRLQPRLGVSGGVPVLSNYGVQVGTPCTTCKLPGLYFSPRGLVGVSGFWGYSGIDLVVHKLVAIFVQSRRSSTSQCPGRHRPCRSTSRPVLARRRLLPALLFRMTYSFCSMHHHRSSLSMYHRQHCSPSPR